MYNKFTENGESKEKSKIEKILDKGSAVIASALGGMGIGTCAGALNVAITEILKLMGCLSGYFIGEIIRNKGIWISQ